MNFFQGRLHLLLQTGASIPQMNHMYRASVKKLLSKVDQENLQRKIENWREEHPEDLFYFRPSALSTSATAETGSETDETCEQTEELLFDVSWGSNHPYK